MNFEWSRMVSEWKEYNGKRNRCPRETSEPSWSQHESPWYLQEDRHIAYLLLALKQNFVSLCTAFQNIVWIQLLSDPREVHKIAKVTGFFAAFCAHPGSGWDRLWEVPVHLLSHQRYFAWYIVTLDENF